MSKEDEVAVFWEKQGKRGTFLSGMISKDAPELTPGTRLIAFRETNKTNPKAPDWRVLIQREYQANGQGPAKKDNDDDRIPF